MIPEHAFRYEALSPKTYEHPADRAATAALHSIPLLDKVIKRLTDLGFERQVRQTMLANSVEIGPDQVPDLWNLYVASAGVLDLESLPPLFVTQYPILNAFAFGAHTPMVVVFSSLVSDLDPPQVQSVLAHELGHVLSEHYYYTTALVLLTLLMQGLLPRSLVTGLPVRALYLSLLEWSRAAELSSDRASTLVMEDPMPTCEMLMRCAGGKLDGMNLDAFVRQATNYEEEEDLFARYTRRWAEMRLTHPFAVRRVKELVRWVSEGDFDRIHGGNYIRRGQEPPITKEFESAVSHYRERFTAVFERTAGGLQRVAEQLNTWLRDRTTEGEDDADWLA